MISFYNNGKKINNIEDNCWINVLSPTKDEIDYLSKTLNISKQNLIDSIDEEEMSRVEINDNYKMTVLDIPSVKNNNKSDINYTVPLVILNTPNYFVTITNSKYDIFNEFINGKYKDIDYMKKSKFTILIFKEISIKYIKDLKLINEKTEKIEKILYKSTKNKELLKLLDLEKTLVYYKTSLKSNNLVLERISKGNVIDLYKEDEYLLEDAITDHLQAIEMIQIYSDILSGMMNTFASIISNNLNTVMKFLTGLTIVISIPTMIASFFGMNIKFGSFADNSFTFIIIVLVSILLSILLYNILKKKNMM